MKNVTPLFAKDRDANASAAHLRQLADAVERGDLQQVVVFSSDRKGRMQTWMSVLPRVGLAGVVGALEIAKAELVLRALDLMSEPEEDADGEHGDHAR